MCTYPNHTLINTDTATAYLGPLLALVVETLCYSELATGILKIGGSFLRQKEAGGKKLFIDFGVERSAIKLSFAGLVYAIVHGSDGIENMETMCTGSFLLGSATLETKQVFHFVVSRPKTEVGVLAWQVRQATEPTLVFGPPADISGKVRQLLGHISPIALLEVAIKVHILVANPDMAPSEESSDIKEASRPQEEVEPPPKKQKVDSVDASNPAAL